MSIVIRNTRIESILPSVSTTSLHYNKDLGCYYTNGWTSAAGNSYCNFFYVSPQIAIKCDFGQGYALSFINGIRVYRYNGRDTELIGEWQNSNYSGTVFSERFVMNKCKQLVADYLQSQLRLQGGNASESEIERIASQVVDEAASFTRSQKMIG